MSPIWKKISCTRDIFGEGILYEKIARDYSKMADPIAAVDSIEILENGDVLLQYYKGEDMELVSEIIETR